MADIGTYRVFCQSYGEERIRCDRGLHLWVNWRAEPWHGGRRVLLQPRQLARCRAHVGP